MNSQVNNVPKRSNKTLALILLVSILPIAGAYFVFFTGIGVPEQTVNAGKLISPINHVTEIFAGEHLDLLEQFRNDKKWRLFLPVTEYCNTECEKIFYTTRQVHIRLGDKSNRLERYAINLAGEKGEQFLLGIAEDHPYLRHVNIDRKRWDQWLASTNLDLDLDTTPYYLLIDQEGYAVMGYSSNIHGNDLLKDLKRALKFTIDFQQ